jgi:hypothetical protein
MKILSCLKYLTEYPVLYGTRYCTGPELICLVFQKKSVICLTQKRTFAQKKTLSWRAERISFFTILPKKYIVGVS